MEHMYIFWEKIERSLQKYSVNGGGGCILWSGSSDGHGYGRKTVTCCTTGKQKVELAHRVAYMLHKKVTELPRTNDAGDLMDVSHLCHEKLCINPDHLVFERHSENMSRDACFRLGSCTTKHSPSCILG